MAGSKVTIGCKLPNGLQAELNGVSVHFNGTNASAVHNGHGITKNVDKEFWDAWLAKNQGLAFVRNGFVFAHEKPASAISRAKEGEKEKTGLEPVDPTQLPKDLQKLDDK